MQHEKACRVPEVKGEYVVEIVQNNGKYTTPRQVVLVDPKTRDLDMMSAHWKRQDLAFAEMLSPEKARYIGVILVYTHGTYILSIFGVF